MEKRGVTKSGAHAMPSSAARRIRYFDLLRGAAIAMVVAIHCFPRSFTPADVGVLSLAIRNALNVAVPVFLAISGYFLAGKDMSGGGYASFLKKQIPRVYVPMLFCSLPYVRWDLRDGLSVLPALKAVTCSYSVFYFVAVIIQCYLLLPFLARRASRKWFAILFVLGFIYGLVNTYVFGVWLHADLPLIVYAGHFVMWGAFFHLGVCHRKNRIALPYGVLWAGALVFLVLSLAESGFLVGCQSSLRGVGQKASAFCLNVFLLEILFHEKTISFADRFGGSAVYRGLCAVGDYSFGIYLTHLLVLVYAVSKIPLWNGRYSTWMAETVLVVAFCLVGLWAAKKALPKASRILLGV